MKPITRQLTSTDYPAFKSLITVFAEVFEWDHTSRAGEQHLHNLLADPRFLVFVALVNDEVVGGITVHILQRYDMEKPAAYIYDVGVMPSFQRKGIGRLLIQSVTEYCQANNFSEAFVQAESNDLEAVCFYRSTKISGELTAIQFTYSIE